MKKLLNDLLTFTKIELTGITFGGALGALSAFVLGGQDKQFMALVCLMILDYFTGVICAIKLGELSSGTGAKGMCKKVAVVFVVWIISIADAGMAMNGILLCAIIGAFSAIEVISIIENFDKLGLGWIFPTFVRNAIKQFKEQKYGKYDEVLQKTKRQEERS